MPAPKPTSVVKPKARGGRPKGSRNLGTKNAAGRAIHRHIRFKNLSQEGLVIQSRSPSPEPRPRAKSATTSSLQHLTIPTIGRPYTASLSPDPPYVGHIHAPTRFSSVDTGYASNSTSPETQYPAGGSHTYGELLKDFQYNTRPAYPSPPQSNPITQWNHFTPNYSTAMSTNNVNCSVDNMSEYYPPPTQNILPNEAEFSMSPATEDIYASLRAEASEHWRTVLNIQHDIDCIGPDISPNLMHDLEAAKHWQRHCLQLYEESSRKVMLLQDGMVSPWPANEPTLNPAAAPKRGSLDQPFTIGEGMGNAILGGVGGVAGDW